jgi:hypothetical protein
MNEWLNETLVAIETTSNGKYRVIELPAKATQRQMSKRRFAAAERAEDYIKERYSNVIRVEPQDITEEIERRSRPVPHPLLAPVMERLQNILAQLEAMPPMAQAGTPRALNEHEAWMNQYNKAQILIDKARDYALWVVPEEVEIMLGRIRDRKHALYPVRQREGDDASCE